MMRGLLAALFTAGCSIMALSWMPGMDPRRLPYVFIIVFVFGLLGSQMQERMRLNSE